MCRSRFRRTRMLVSFWQCIARVHISSTVHFNFLIREKKKNASTKVKKQQLFVKHSTTDAGRATVIIVKRRKRWQLANNSPEPRVAGDSLGAGKRQGPRGVAELIASLSARLIRSTPPPTRQRPSCLAINQYKYQPFGMAFYNNTNRGDVSPPRFFCPPRALLLLVRPSVRAVLFIFISPRFSANAVVSACDARRSRRFSSGRP